MILEGIKLMLLGMLVVFSFLVLLYFVVTGLGMFFKKHTQQEADQIEAQTQADAARSAAARKKAREAQNMQQGAPAFAPAPALEPAPVYEYASPASTASPVTSGSEPINDPTLVAVISAAIQKFRLQ